ncbi:MAG: hypothetical protein MHM6MM_005495 [Cercozoa sp. M6MM]
MQSRAMRALVRKSNTAWRRSFALSRVQNARAAGSQMRAFATHETQQQSRSFFGFGNSVLTLLLAGGALSAGYWAWKSTASSSAPVAPHLDMSAQQNFLTENAQKEDVTVTPSGLQYKVLVEGDGKKPASASNRVEVHYEGRLIDGTIFDSSYKRGQTITFGLNQVIPGWTEGVMLMKEGSTYELYIPSDLGYGPRGIPGTIPPAATLIFKVELKRVL